MNSLIEVNYEGMYAGIIKVIDVIQNKICKWKIK